MKHAVIALVAFVVPATAQDIEFGSKPFTDAEKAQIYHYYEPIGKVSNSSHWHDYDCCQSYRCFPAKPGSVRWTPQGYAIRMPDGSIQLFAEYGGIWKPKKGEGNSDPRDHICFERENGEWIVLCGYRAGVQG